MATVAITAKLKITPTEEQIPILRETMSRYTNACNFVSEHIFTAHTTVYRRVNDALYRTLRGKFDLGAQFAQSVERTVIARYKAIESAEHPWTQVAFKKPQADLVWNRDYSLSGDIFSVGSLEGRLKIPYVSTGMERFFDGSWKFGTARLLFKHGKWFLHVSVSKEVPDLDCENLSDIVGVDLGLNFLLTTYDNEDRSIFVNCREIKHRRGQYKRLRKELQQRRTPSARRKLKKTGSRENRWMQDVNHCASKALVDAYPENTLFVLEDLTGIRSATEKVAVRNRYVQVSWAFYDLRKKIEYKASMKNSLVVAVDPAYTSQTCPVCGHQSKSNRDKKKHRFCCKCCGYQSNDDRIGAMNLHLKGLEYLCSLETESTD